MAELRLVPFGVNYWHVVDDTEGKEGIIGSILKNERPEDLLPWRAEFAPIYGSISDLAVGYCRTQLEAIEWLERNLAEYENKEA